ncbi:MAG: hypothetical protein Fur0015_09320 [Ignavibacteriales bacterium]
MKRNFIEIGSKTAKDGFENEKDVVNKFNNWKKDEDAQNWLQSMDYNVTEIEKVEAELIPGHHKADVQVRVWIYSKTLIGIENISIKLVSNPRGFNQIDKRQVDKYVEMWNIPNHIAKSLKLFTGEIKPTQLNIRDKRRLFLNEMDKVAQESIISFFSQNKIMILTDILKGNDEFSANWFMVVWKMKNRNPEWIIRDINYVLNFFGIGDTKITSQGSLKIGKVTMQRKGGDAGRVTSQMLQFKINPIELFES